MGRAPCCDKSNVKRGPWSPEEDAVLKSYVDKHGHGGNWIALPQKAGLKRCGKSCRLRWLNYLRPDIKHGGFTDEEDNIIVSLYNKLGSRWSVIASHLPGRTDNDVKNYWNTKLKKKLTAMKQQKQLLATGQAANQFDMQSIFPAPSLPLQHIPVIKAEVYSHIEEFCKPLQPNFVLSNIPHKYNSEAQSYLEKIVSLPVSDEVSATSSLISVENHNSLINWIGSDDVLFSDFNEIISGFGDSVPSCNNKSVTFS